jgi:hypothetical protein
MTVLHVRHRTVYRYREAVHFGEHRLMSRPRGSHDLRLIDTTLVVQPTPSQVRWIHDPFGNSIAILNFDTPAPELIVESAFRAQHFPLTEQALEVEPYASTLPFWYAPDEARDLKLLAERHYPGLRHSQSCAMSPNRSVRSFVTPLASCRGRKHPSKRSRSTRAAAATWPCS